MMFRTRLLLIFTVTIVAAIGLVEALVLASTREAFERAQAQRTAVLTAQFRNEFKRRGQETVRTVTAIASLDAVRKIALQPETAEYYDAAAPLARSHALDLLELVSGDGTIVSSAEWPARFGYKEDWLTSGEDWSSRGAFLRREELEQRTTLSLVAVGVAAEGDRKLYVVGGQELDRDFLGTLVLPEGMRVLLYQNLEPQFTPANLIGAAGPAAHAEVLRPLIERVLRERRELSTTIGSGADAESFQA
ncbi:MAG: integral rane sensor signal transduction histidine kinase, partial [Candidatus Solibacter sp.]|nr:integral rane sensor signal transduction histidine kinase [Candidatus Solibacter sp.]